MKSMMLRLTLALLCLHATVQAQVVSLNASNMPLEKVLAAVKRQTGYVVFYNKGLLDNTTPVSLEARSMPLSDFMSLALRYQPVDFEISNKTVVLKKRVVVAPPAGVTGEVVIARIMGVIRDAGGTPLYGASVRVKNGRQGTSTDAEGRYELTDVPVQRSLIISYVGFENVEVAIHKQSNGDYTAFAMTQEQQKIISAMGGKDGIVMSASLQPGNNSLGGVQVVATGYQKVRKATMTGSIASVNAKELVLNGNNTIEQALQGKLAGVVVNNPSGQVGTRQKIRVRGTSTLLGNQEPVWVVDGIIQEDPLPFKATDLNALSKSDESFDVMRNFVGSAISWLNPNDIEDITVLRDAASTAIYGVKAANGVIVITTKRGKAGN